MAAPILVVSGPSGAGKTTVARLVSAAFDLSAHIRSDDFMPFVVNGWVDPNLPEAGPQSHVLGAAVAGAAIEFAEGGYTVVLDGHWFPEGLDGLAQWCIRRGVPLHYAVLRPEDLSGPAEEVTAAVLSAFAAGRLVEVELIGGIEQRDVELVGHDPAWAARFETERRRIADALGDGVRVEHIGSTAVPGLVAKPIVDVQVSVADVSDEASYLPALVGTGYELRVRERGHRMLRTPERDVHVHVCDAGSEWEHRHVDFRDRLRSSSVDRDRYAAVKRYLAAQGWSSMNSYAAAKSEVIAEIMERPGRDE